MRVEVGPIVAAKAAQLGGVGRAWLADLPELVAHLERKWSISIGAPIYGGTAAYVAWALTDTGAPAVVKLAVPDPYSAHEAETLAAARGQGYVRLLAADPERHAMLLEALGPSMDRLGLSPERQLETLCDVLAVAWRVQQAAAPARDQASGLADLVSRLWQDLDRPCSERVIATALDFAGQRRAAMDPDRAVVLHGDAAPPNALQVPSARAGAVSGFVFVDPDGFLGEPAYDLGVALRDWCPQLLAGDTRALADRYCDLLAVRSGVDRAAIWQWGFLERVSTGLYLLSLGAGELSRSFLEAAERLAVT